MLCYIKNIHIYCDYWIVDTCFAFNSWFGQVTNNVIQMLKLERNVKSQIWLQTADILQLLDYLYSSAHVLFWTAQAYLDVSVGLIDIDCRRVEFNQHHWHRVNVEFQLNFVKFVTSNKNNWSRTNSHICTKQNWINKNTEVTLPESTGGIDGLGVGLWPETGAGPVDGRGGGGLLGRAAGRAGLGFSVFWEWNSIASHNQYRK